MPEHKSSEGRNLSIDWVRMDVRVMYDGARDDPTILLQYLTVSQPQPSAVS